VNDFAAIHAEPVRETGPIGAFNPKSVPPPFVMTSSSELP
jgi:hypothetical protein